MDQYNYFKRAWASTKEAFIHTNSLWGQTREQAEKNWQDERRYLKEHGVKYPRAELIEKYGVKEYDPEGFSYLPESAKEEIFRQVEEAERAHRIEQAQIQKAKFQDEEWERNFGESHADNGEDMSRRKATDSGDGPSNKKTPNREEDMQEPTNPNEHLLYDGGPEEGDEGGFPANASSNMGFQGGGLAGAGNNTLFKGFAKSTKPRCPEEYSYVDYYTRPFATHTFFPEQTLHGCQINGTPQYTPDRLDAEAKGYNAEMYAMHVDHGGIIIPYWIMEASMLDCDWNKPLDHIAYKVEEFGFDIPNLRLSILNNPRKDVNEVAPAPPADARMWMFTDLNNDYGIPESYTPVSIQHNYYFQQEDIISTDDSLYALPVLGSRTFLLSPGQVTQVLGDRRFVQDEDGASASDPNAGYNMKRHPGYHEFTLNTAKMGLSYKPNAPIVRLPGAKNQDPMLTIRQSDLSQTWTGENAYWGGLHMWTTMTQQFRDGMSPVKHDDVMPGMLNYYVHGTSAIAKTIIDNDPLTTDEQRVHDQIGSEQLRPAANPAVALAATKSVFRGTGRYNVTDDGTVHTQHASKRPPIFMFGVHKELEYRASKSELWRYVAYGQINYWCKIRWYVKPCRFPMYYNIGLGGLLTDQYDANGKPREAILKDKNRAMMRATMKPMITATAYEAPDTKTDVRTAGTTDFIL